MLYTNYTDYDQMPVILTTPQLAEILGIGRNAAYELVRSGKIKSVHIGRQIRIPRDSLIQFLSENNR